MSNAHRHIIGQILLEVETCQSSEVWGVQEELSQLLQVAIPQMEQWFDEWIGTDAVVRLDQLVIELPAIAPHDLADEFVPKLLIALRQALDDLPPPTAADTRQPFMGASAFPIADPTSMPESETVLLAQAPPEADWEILLYFLEYGRLPWWQLSEPLSVWVLRWEAVIQSNTFWRSALQQLFNRQPLARQRLVLQLPDSFHQPLILQMQPAWRGFWELLDAAKALMRSIALDDRTTHYLEQQAWIFLFAEIQLDTSISAPLPTRSWLQTWLPLLCNVAIAAGTTHQQVRNLIAARSFPETALWLEVIDRILSPETLAPVEGISASMELTPVEQAASSDQMTDLETIVPIPPIKQLIDQSIERSIEQPIEQSIEQPIELGHTDTAEAIAPSDQSIPPQQPTENAEIPPSDQFILSELVSAIETIVPSDQSAEGEQMNEQVVEAVKQVAEQVAEQRSEQVPEQFIAQSIEQSITQSIAQPINTEAIAASEPLAPSEQSSASPLPTSLDQPTESELISSVDPALGSEPDSEPDSAPFQERTDTTNEITPQQAASQLPPPAEEAIASSNEFINAAQTSGVDPISAVPLSNVPSRNTPADAMNQTEPPSEELLHPLMANPPRQTLYVSLSPAESANGIYLNHAGLVLLHPFLRFYFEAVGLVSENTFRHEYAQQIAIALLHYLATRETNAPEYALVLPKLLCGWPLNDPVLGGLELSEAALAEGENLLETVIQYWEVLKNTSPDGLRQGFLQRPGKLTRTEMGGWKLRVEQQSIDILLSRLPWGVSMVKLPWMAEVLVVEWM